MLLIGVDVELLLLGVLLFLEPLVSLLGQAPPTTIGWLIAAPAVLLADAARKHVLGLRRRGSSLGSSSA